MRSFLYKIVVVWAVCLMCVPSAIAQVSPVDAGRPSTVEPSGYGGQVVKDERPRSSLTFKALKVGQACDQAQLDRVLRQRQRIFAYCHERAMALDPTLAGGRLTLAWTIDREGRVSGVEQGRATLKAPQVAACVGAQLERALFRGVVKGEALTCAARYRLTFKADRPKPKPKSKTKPKTKPKPNLKNKPASRSVVSRPAPRRAHIAITPPAVDGPCDEIDVWQRADAKVNAFRYCHEKELPTKPTLAGEVTLGWTIKADGAARKPAVTSTTLKDNMVEACLARVVERLRFAQPGQLTALPQGAAGDVPPAECRVEMKMTFSPLKP